MNVYQKLYLVLTNISKKNTNVSALYDIRICLKQKPTSCSIYNYSRCRLISQCTHYSLLLKYYLLVQYLSSITHLSISPRFLMMLKVWSTSESVCLTDLLQLWCLPKRNRLRSPLPVVVVPCRPPNMFGTSSPF